MPDLFFSPSPQDVNAGEGRTVRARDEVLTPEEAADAWFRFLFRVGPRVDGVVLRTIAERLAGDTEPEELLALSADLVAIAGVVAEEAMCDAPA
jgi:hypothetical protein